jgi:hypothetical protein
LGIHGGFMGDSSLTTKVPIMAARQAGCKPAWGKGEEDATNNSTTCGSGKYVIGS